MLDDIKRTGSVSQDALRLGFQTTCNKGIAHLLKVDDITVEECDKFKQKHLDNVDKELLTITEVIENNLVEEFKDVYNNEDYKPKFFLWKLWREFLLKRTDTREYNVTVVSIGDHVIDIENGSWTTDITLEITAKPWNGIYDGDLDKTFPEEVYQIKHEIRTNAMKCNVKYIDYHNYSDRYIPDDATSASREAIEIGMTDLKVAYPIIQETKNPVPDPIIVGKIGNQMFIIAWFGYDKTDHMSCNV